jgi:hypothetical protein
VEVLVVVLEHSAAVALDEERWAAASQQSIVVHSVVEDPEKRDTGSNDMYVRTSKSNE